MTCDVLEPFLNPIFFGWTIGLILSAAVYLYCKRWLIMRIGANSTAAVDSCLTILVWLTSIAFNFEDFDQGQQFGSIIILMFGSGLFTRFVRLSGLYPDCEATYEDWYQSVGAQQYCGCGLVDLLRKIWESCVGCCERQHEERNRPRLPSAQRRRMQRRLHPGTRGSVNSDEVPSSTSSSSDQTYTF